MTNETKDNYGRPIVSIRISITNRCNENCLYCHHDCMIPSEKEMTADEIYTICKIAKNLGVRKVRISGGEPLIRNDIVEIIEKINSLDFKDISITTNGSLLGKYAEDLKKAGLDRVNVSLDTLNYEKHKMITGKNHFKQVIDGILKAVEVDLYPVKINTVLMKGVNEKEVYDLFEFTKKHGIVLQLIELMTSENCDDNKFSQEYHYNLENIEKELEQKADKVIVRKFMQNRRKYYIDGGEIEIVRPMDNSKFCEKCSRLRITPEGKIKPCLLRNDNLVELVSFIKKGLSEKELEEIFIKGINNREPYYKD